MKSIAPKLMRKKKDNLYTKFGDNFMSTGDLTKFNSMFTKKNADEYRDGADNYLEDMIHQSIYPLSKRTLNLKQDKIKKIPFELGVQYK